MPQCRTAIVPPRAESGSDARAPLGNYGRLWPPKTARKF